jgi:hypothetical protein
VAKQKKDKSKNRDKKGEGLAPDPETLHTTDPQEKMKGPVSSVVQDLKEEAEENEEKDKKDGKV